jgi:hypothetical protein
MTSISGKNVLRTPCCGTFVSTAAYGSINLMAYEYWTDGRNVGSLMPGDGGLRVCSCGVYYLIGDCERVMWIPRPKPIAFEGWESTKSNWWTRLLGKPTKADIMLHCDTRPLHEIEAEQIKVPESKHVPDSSMPEVFNQKNANPSLLIVARRRYWRFLNDPFREIYREHRKLHGESFPHFHPSDQQADNMYQLIELLQRPHSSNWVEIAELLRELGDFSTANENLKTYQGNSLTLARVVFELNQLCISAPARYKH